MNKPLVSIMIPNYNYGRYLRQCFDSVLNQTYENIDVYFRDNNSSDDSFDIAMEYVGEFKKRNIPFVIANNKQNVGSDRNTDFLLRDSEGAYGYVLASDDFIAPTFIERCVSVFQKHPEVSLVMTNRAEVDENSNIRELAPFYNCDCIIPSEDQAGVFMMAGIAVPCQRMYNTMHTQRMGKFRKNWFVAGDWYNNFLGACSGDVAYLKEPLCYYRTHFGNETNESEKRLAGSFEHYLLINTFAAVAEAIGMKKPQQRYDEAVRHLGEMCPRYALKMLQNSLPDIAKKYLRLALVYNPDMEQNEDYQALWHILRDDNLDRIAAETSAYAETHNLNRTKSYDPPEGWRPLDI